jgi:hypothetical protein
MSRGCKHFQANWNLFAVRKRDKNKEREQFPDS